MLFRQHLLEIVWKGLGLCLEAIGYMRNEVDLVVKVLGYVLGGIRGIVQKNLLGGKVGSVLSVELVLVTLGIRSDFELQTRSDNSQSLKAL